MEYFPRLTTLQLISKVQELITKMGDPSQFKGRIIFMSMFNDSCGELKTINATATLVSLFAKDFQHSSDLDQKTSGILLTMTDHEKNGTDPLN